MHRYRLPSVSTDYPPTREDEGLMRDETIFDSEENTGEMIPYAHRDIKPA